MSRLVLIVHATLLGSHICAATEPPIVSATQPALHETDVVPGETHVVFRFDQDMDTSAVSLQALPGTQAEIKGAPWWENPRELVVPVVLEAGREFVFGLNTMSRNNMRSAVGVPVEPFVLAFRTVSDDRSEQELNPASNKASVGQIRTAIRERYSHRDFQDVDWNNRVDEFESRLVGCRTGDEFALWFTALMAPARDGHLWVRRHGGFWPTHKENVQRNYREETTRARVPGWRQYNSFLQVGEFEDGIRYLAVTGLNARHLPSAMNSMGFAWRHFGRQPMILDLRMNGGGSESIALVIVSGFVTESKIYASHIRLDKSSPSGFGEPYFRKMQPALFAPHQTGKIAVLMGAGNASSAESFICMMRQVKQAKLFGQRSMGSTGNPQPFMLDNGVELMIPSWIMKDAEGRVVQGKGLLPDVLIETTEQDFRDGDPVLEAALAWLRE